MYGPPREYLECRRYIRLDSQSCVGCMACLRYCPTEGVFAPSPNGVGILISDRSRCAGCAKCVGRCPSGALKIGV
jgi:NAD-dependent dihydropyrimidine dehydrogenase PreA subunit